MTNDHRTRRALPEIQRLRQLLSQGAISRREFLSRTAALGLATFIPTGLVDAHTDPLTPKRGGHLRLAINTGSASDSLDPTKNTSNLTRLLFSTFLSQLTEINNKGDLEPLLAESYEPNSDATQWIFKLRKDIVFQNGKSLDADDVIVSLQRHGGKNSTSPDKSLVEGIASIRKDGSLNVVFHLNEANVDFPYLLSDAMLGILPTKDGRVETFGIGTGAYSIETFDPGTRATLRRNPSYFRNDRAFFDSAEVLVISDTTARETALLSGDIDVIGTVSSSTAGFLGAKNGINVIAVTGAQHYPFPMRTDMPPFDNNDVRLALKYAIDRQEILDKVLRGYGTLGNDQPIGPTYRFYDPQLPQRSYDIDKARFHLKKAAVGPLKLQISATDGVWPGAMDTVLLYREQAAKAGIQIIPKRVPTDGFWSNVWMHAPWCSAQWSGRPTADWMFTQAYAADSNWNDTFWKNKRFNTLLKAARGELNEERRRAMYWEMQRLVRDDGGALIPLFGKHILASSTKVGHPDVVAGNMEYDGFKLIERWWMT